MVWQRDCKTCGATSGGEAQRSCQHKDALAAACEGRPIEIDAGCHWQKALCPTGRGRKMRLRTDDEMAEAAA